LTADQLPVDHAQLSGSVTDALRRRGITTIGEMLEFSSRSAFYQFPHACDVLPAVRALERARDGRDIDWPAYWDLRGKRFHHLAARLPALDKLSDTARTYPVTKDSFGNAGVMLAASGITNLGKLRDGLLAGLGHVRGLGKGKLSEFFVRLVEVAGKVGPDGEISDQPVQVEMPPVDAGPLAPRLNEAARSLPLSVLQLGAKHQHFAREGYRTVGCIEDTDPVRLTRIISVGPGTIRDMNSGLAALRQACNGDAVDLARYCQLNSFNLLPQDPPASGRAMLESLPELLTKFGDLLPDETRRAILRERLLRVPREQTKLEELGRRHSPPVTRERVRQIEGKMLRQLAGSLIWNDVNDFDVLFHPEFTRWWRMAAHHFCADDEIGFSEFLGRLSQLWGVPPGDLTPHLPIILAIVTGEPQMAAAFRAGVRLDSRLLGNLPEETRQIPLKHLRMGKNSARLGQRGIDTLGKLIAAAPDMSLPAKVEEHLEVVARSLAENGRLQWDRYAAALELPTVPPAPPVDCCEFIDGFIDAVASFLGQLGWHRWEPIFRQRTSRPASTRPTLDRMSKILDTHGPMVKRDETLLLERLHDILIEGHFATLPVWLDETWLRYVADAKSAFKSSGPDMTGFQSALALRCGVTPRSIEAALPALWAILTGYPEGRNRRGRPVQGPAAGVAPVEPAKIRLRGFRRLH
jgi:hypothetical protein